MYNIVDLEPGLELLVQVCHGESRSSTWWDGIDFTELHDKDSGNVVPLKISLMHSELSEALEGWRKRAMDDHLPQYSSIEVELADAIIRIADLAGALSLDLAGALVAKLIYNRSRADHKADARARPSGKRF